mgnify:CR=1 FL=1
MELQKLQKAISVLNEVDSLKYLSETFPGDVTFSTSFGYEDQIITDLIISNNIPISLFTLDTGRLFPETYSTWVATQEQYKIHIKPYYPDSEHISDYVEKNGPNAFYNSPELRKECCRIRKVEPLNKALKGKKVWVTGMRADQSAARHDLPLIEWDADHQLFKFHPLLHWSLKEVKDYILKKNIPYNPLHDKNFVSIGCAPCTRAIQFGEDFRAGRWWWEDNSKKECGLHVHKS